MPPLHGLAKAQPGLVKAQPVLAKAQPVLAKAQPVLVKAQPMDVEHIADSTATASMVSAAPMADAAIRAPANTAPILAGAATNLRGSMDDVGMKRYLQGGAVTSANVKAGGASDAGNKRQRITCPLLRNVPIKGRQYGGLRPEQWQGKRKR
jgi:hypothetical protein